MWYLAAWKALRHVPWWAWIVAATFAAAYWYGERRYDAGVVDERTEWQEAQAVADANQREAVQVRDEAAATVADETDWTAREAAIQARTETAAAVERVRHVTRTITVPADCPGLPASVSDEGREAVQRARAAQGAVRAAKQP